MPTMQTRNEGVPLTAVQYLYQHEQLSIAIEDQKLLIDSLRSVAEKMVSELQADRVQSSSDGRNSEAIILNIAEEEEWLQKLVDARESIGYEIADNVRRYAPIQAVALLGYYIECDTLEAIGLSHPERKSRQWALDTRRKGEELIQAALMTHPEKFTSICLTRKED